MGFLSWVPFVGDILDAVTGTFDSISTNSTNKSIANMNVEQQQRTNEWNYRMNKENNENNQRIASAYNANQVQLQNDMNNFNKEMWNLNNAYNSPAQQLERARAAGINPNIVFGQPVASSPVQQTSIPQQALSEMRPYRADAPQNDFKAQTKGLKSIGNAMRNLGKLPFIKEQLDFLKEQVRGARADNEAKEYDLQGKKDADAFYNGAAFYRHHDGSYITGDDFEKLSDNEKENYLNQSMPYVTINGEKKPNYDAYRMPFKNKAEFEAYKDVLNFPNFKANISADMQQNKLRDAVAKGQLQNNDVVQHLIDMPTMQYKQIYHSLQKLIQEYNWNEETHEIRKHILELNEKQIQNAVDHDIFTYIDKIFAKDDMSISDWFKLAFAAMASFVHR